MASGFNNITIVGNLGKDAELRYLPSGTPVLNASVAVNEEWTDGQTGEKKSKTEWMRIAIFGNRAESVKPYLVKGKQIMASGKASCNAYIGSDGKAYGSVEIRVDELRLLGGSNGNSTETAPAAAAGEDNPF